MSDLDGVRCPKCGGSGRELVACGPGTCHTGCRLAADGQWLCDSPCFDCKGLGWVEAPCKQGSARQEGEA